MGSADPFARVCSKTGRGPPPPPQKKKEEEGQFFFFLKKKEKRKKGKEKKQSRGSFKKGRDVGQKLILRARWVGKI